MRIPRIYTGSSIDVLSKLELDSHASQHIAKVLRMQEGGALKLFNGDGNVYTASIVQVSKKSVTVQVEAKRDEDCESPVAIHLGIAVSRGDRMDWVAQKATELGVAEITPLFTERTEVKLKGDRAEKKLMHWRQITINACQQCGRNRLPVVNSFANSHTWTKEVDAESKLILHHRALSSDKSSDECSAPVSIALLIGPEGGLSEDEIVAAEKNGFQSLRLGPRVLRTETAPLAAIAILQSRWGDMTP
jgi:16S rRNA (uracil1498-N3)-methyltransferase